MGKILSFKNWKCTNDKNEEHYFTDWANKSRNVGELKK